MNSRILFLCGLAIFTGCSLRVVLAGDFRLGFLVWNIFLAAVPLLLIPVFRFLDSRGNGLVEKAGKLLTAFAWLLFLPNAFYILTDFMHLNSRVLVNAREDYANYSLVYERGDGLFVYDTFLLFAATLFGAYVGGIALVQAYIYFRIRVSKSLASAGIISIMILSAVGVYIGRFGRWNSWDGLTYPHKILSDLFDNLLTSETRKRFLLVVVTMVIFQIASFLYVAYHPKNKLHAKKAIAKPVR